MTTILFGSLLDRSIQEPRSSQKATNPLLFHINSWVSMRRSLTVAIIGTVFALMFLPTSMNLQTSNAASLITVPTDYPTIQSAIEAASPGDTIEVLPGTYTEQLTISKSLTLVGSGATATVIKAPAMLDTNVLGLTYIVQINGGATVNMKGFTFDAGNSCDAFFGITVFDSATLNLDTSIITGCYQVGVIAGGHTYSRRATNRTRNGHKDKCQWLSESRHYRTWASRYYACSVI